ncbi:HNH endonuclease [bacterium]|nr:HNH endonuclease [bacterium]
MPRWLIWWFKEGLVGLVLGLFQGFRIGWYEIRAVKILKECKRQNIKLYDLDIWDLLRSITFKRQRDRHGVVVCSGCKIPTHEPHCHHIKHVAYAPKLAFSPGNLTGLCPHCHQDQHPEIDLGHKRVPLPVRQVTHGHRLRRGQRLRRRHRALRPEDLVKLEGDNLD